ncbi:transposase [Nostoc sp. NIES-4103]|nr:transposase [Nostoc sp. NIES-4103]
MELTDSLKSLLKETAHQLKGAAKRKFIAQTVVALGYGGQSLAERELGWNRATIGKGIKELNTGITCFDNYRSRGRKKSEEILPNLLEDIKKLVDSQSQIDPSFKSQRLYTRLSAAQVRHQYGLHPVVKLVTGIYSTGVSLTKQAMQEIENQIQRLSNLTSDNLPNLGKWFVDICYETA